MSNDELEPVRQLCREAIHRLDARHSPAIDARIVANRVAMKIDPERTSPSMMYLCGIDAIAQVARSVLRNSHDLPDIEGDPTPEQIDAFGKRLQMRYSIQRQGWPAAKYVMRESITKQEIRDIVLPALAKHRDAYRKHWDLLNRWNDERPDAAQAVAVPL